MPSSSSFHRTLAKKKRNGPTHKEVMEKRHAKRKKNEKKNLKEKKMKTLREYQRLSKIEYSSKKTTAMNLMELVEDIKEKIPDGSYLQMMDQLMALNKETESHQVESQTRQSIRRETAYQDESDDEDYIVNYFRDYYFDRTGERDYINDNIIREDNINREDNIINPRGIEIERRLIDRLTDINRLNYTDNWYRTAEGNWRERNPNYGIGARA
jgi:anti-sigma28 factor (negative regulator of flagellin synthesis)